MQAAHMAMGQTLLAADKHFIQRPFGVSHFSLLD
jgi:hypothetical protein